MLYAGRSGEPGAGGYGGEEAWPEYLRVPVVAAGAAAPLHQLNAEPLLHGDQPVLVGPAQQGELQSSSDTYPYYTCTVYSI